MKIMRLAEVAINPGDRVFRHSPAKALMVGLGVIGAGAGLIVLGQHGDSVLAYYLAGVMFVSLLVMHKFILARFESSNWLVRMNEEGIFLQFRSYLNHHFPEQDFTVVFVPYREIRSVRQVDERREIPYRDLDRPHTEKTSVRHLRLVEFEVMGDTAALEKALADERMQLPRNATLYKHYPVRMASSGRVQVEWTVTPGLEVFLKSMRRYTNTAEPAKILQDYTKLAGQSREQQEQRLLELIQAGQTLDAVYIARKLYSYDLKEAKDFVEDLRNSRK